MKFRKKPVVIEAWPFSQRNEMPQDFKNAIHFQYLGNTAEGGIEYWIETLEGSMAIDYDDWIIKGVKSEFYPCKPDIFEMTYEAVNLD